MNLDEFGKIMDEFLEENRIQLLIDIPEGTIIPTFKSNHRFGSVLNLYILMQSINTCVKAMIREFAEKDVDFDARAFLRETLKLIGKEIEEGLE